MRSNLTWEVKDGLSVSNVKWENMNAAEGEFLAIFDPKVVMMSGEGGQ